MKRLFFLILAGLILFSCTDRPTPSYVEFVDPIIGADGFGHVFVGASVPFGMVQLGPQQPYQGWDWCSSYYYPDTLIAGFTHSHLSGTGVGDLGDILLMPLDPNRPRKVERTGYLYADLDHSLETVRPGYYSLEMPDYGIKAELAATERVGLHRYTFSSQSAELYVDLEIGTGRLETIAQSEVTVVDSTHIVGFRRSNGWAKDQIYYFAAEFSVPFTGVQDVTNDEEFKPRCKEDQDNGIFRKPEAAHNGVKNIFSFDLGEDQVLQVKVALSPVSEENAVINLQEIPAWDFEKVVADAQLAWNKELSRIEIDPLDESVGRIFYTALYHYAMAPIVFYDPDGSYRGADLQVHHSDTPIYTIFSLWDTYRTDMPMMSLIDPDRARDIALTFLKIYHEQGKLPIWHLCANETYCMVGNPGVIILGDLLLKGIMPESVREESLDAMVTSSMLDERGLDLLKEYGYIPYDKGQIESLSKDMEYAIADAAVARVAKLCGDEENAEYFETRSKSYAKYFDPETKFVRGLSSDGHFLEPFDPYRNGSREGVYTEGNAWQYTWLVPHDVHGLIDLFGDDESFVEKLDSLFIVGGEHGPYSEDITGLIGEYAHGNEPSHHIVYLYSYVGQQWRCAELVRKIMKELYTDAPDGLCGNEDVGQMSAWYILSALGLYQVDPVAGVFLIGSPAVHSATIHVWDGKEFRIEAKDNSDENIYVQSAKLNGKPLTKSYITFNDIISGGKLELQMGSEPSDFGSAVDARP